MRNTKLFSVGVYIPLFIALIITLFPIYWLVNTSFKFDKENLIYPPAFIPEQPTLTNYVKALGSIQLSTIINSTIIAVVSSLIVVLIAIPAAYSLARLDPKWGDDLALWILSNRMMPPVATVIPLFIVLKTLGLLDRHLGLIIVYIAFNLPFAVWMLRGFLVEIPRDLEDSALVDGCTRLTALRKILIPVISAGIITTLIFCLIFAWSEFLFASILTRLYAKTLTVQIATYWGIKGLVWGEMSALATISAIPMIVLALVVQKYIVRGMTFGMVKG